MDFLVIMTIYLFPGIIFGVFRCIDSKFSLKLNIIRIVIPTAVLWLPYLLQLMWSGVAYVLLSVGTAVLSSVADCLEGKEGEDDE